MIVRRTNGPKRVQFSDLSIDGQPVPMSRKPYFRLLYLRRGQWVPLRAIMDAAEVTLEREAQDTLARFALELPKGFTLEKKNEPVFPEATNPDREMYHWYYRLTTPDTLPPPVFRGEATFLDTDWEEVPLEEAPPLDPVY